MNAHELREDVESEFDLWEETRETGVRSAGDT